MRAVLGVRLKVRAAAESEDTGSLAGGGGGSSAGGGPVGGPAASRDVDSLQAEKMASAPRILIVDDEPTVRRVCSMALKSEGWHAETESSPARALERLRSGEQFDVVVLDYAMPEMSGVELLRALLHAGVARRPKILMASAQADGAVAHEVLALGVWDLLEKPLTPEDLRGRIRRIMTREIAAEAGDRMARTLVLAGQCRWADALRTLGECLSLREFMLRGLLLEFSGDRERAAETFRRAHWRTGWSEQGAEIWSELSRRLDLEA